MENETGKDAAPAPRPRWRIVGAIRRHDIATTTIEADNPHAACAAGLEELEDDWDAWEPAKRSSSAFVDTLERLDGDTATELPVPPAFAAHARTGEGTAIVTLVMRNGLIQSAEIPHDAHVKLRIEDEDTEGAEPSDIERGADGREYVVSTWG